MIWSLAAIICLALLSFTGAWVDILDNVSILSEDLMDSWGNLNLIQEFALGDSIKRPRLKFVMDNRPTQQRVATGTITSVSMEQPAQPIPDAPVQYPAVHLTSENWDEFHRTHESVFVNLYAPWCTWSKNLAPVWDEFSTFVKEQDAPLAVAKVDCVQEAELCRREKVLAFPSIRWYEKGKQMGLEYRADRTVAAFWSHALLQISGVNSEALPQDSEMEPVQGLSDYQESEEEDEEDEQNKLMLTLNKPLSTSEFLATKYGESNARVTDPIPVLTLNLGDLSEDLSSEATETISLSEESSEDQIEDPFHIFIYARTLTETNWQKAHLLSHAVFVDLYAPWCVWCQRLAPVWDTFAKTVQEENLPVMVARVDCVTEADLCRQEKIMAFPTLRWYENGVKVGTDYKMDRTVHDLMKFARLHLSGDYHEEDMAEEEMDAQAGGEEPEDALELSPDEDSEFFFDDLSASTDEKVDLELEESSRDEVGAFDRIMYAEDIFEGEEELNVPTVANQNGQDLLNEPGEAEDFFEADGSESEILTDYSLDFSESRDVFHSIEITESNWDHVMSSSPDVFVYFGAAWCSHSRRYQPIWESFAEESNRLSLPLAVARVDCVLYERLCRDQDIRVYPTGRWYRHGCPSWQYQTEEEVVTTDMILEFAQKLLKEPHDDVTDRLYTTQAAALAL